MELRLVLPVPISINSLYVNQFMYDHRLRRRVPTGGRVLSASGEKQKKDIQNLTREQMKVQNWDYEWTVDKNSFIYLDVDVYFARRGRDSDNLFKLLHDSLEKIVFDNDSRVLPRVQRILYDKDSPRVEVTLSPTKSRGIFKTPLEAEQFEGICKSCTRYLSGRCSILVDSLSATVRSEIGDVDNPICEKYKEKK